MWQQQSEEQLASIRRVIIVSHNFEQTPSPIMPVVTRSQLKKAQINVVAEHKDAGFPAFRKLPAEVRVMIWKFAADEPRVLELVLHRRYPAIILGGPTVRVVSKCPSILAVCREARLVGQETYITFFRFITHQPNAYFNPGRDSIRLPDKMLSQWFLLALRMACREFIVNLDGEPAPNILIDCKEAIEAWYARTPGGYGAHGSIEDIDSSSFLLRVPKFDPKRCDSGRLAKLVVDCETLPPLDSRV
jgi:hypothetical protein